MSDAGKTVARAAVSILVGGLLAYYWQLYRDESNWLILVAVGLAATIIVYLLLSKLAHASS